MIGISLAALILQMITLHAPAAEQTNAYKLTETVWTSEFGKVVMTGTEKRHIATPAKGKRKVEITFEVNISGKDLHGAKAERWARTELVELRIPDQGTLDDLNRLVERDGVAADAYPIFTSEPVKTGSTWQATANGVKCRYFVDKIESGHVVISTDSHHAVGQGVLRRSGSWTVEISTGRLLSWHLRSEVTYAGGKSETVDSSGQFVD